MIESIFTFESTRSRQRDAPLLKEREEYLSHMLDQGVSKRRVCTIASMLLHIVRLMELNCLRMIDVSEIKEGSQRWLLDTAHKTRRPGETSVESFTHTAMNWFRFHKLMDVPAVLEGPADVMVAEFVHFMTITRGLATQTAKTHSSRVVHFLRWALARNEQLSKVSLEEVDAFLESKRAGGCSPKTIVSYCTALRLFFRYAEMRGWNRAKIARGILSPRISRLDTRPRGPKWRDVRRTISSISGTNPAALRAAAIFSLCSIYALRSSEVVNLLLSDFDWMSETFTVRRSKRGRTQQFPIQYEVGMSILSYLQYGRPLCCCRHVFVTLRPPYRPVMASCLWTIVGPRMKQLGIDSGNFGPHSLRHACATELLRKGSSLQDIADFLGHRNMRSVSIYAKYDVRSLKQVAAFSLAGVK